MSRHSPRNGRKPPMSIVSVFHYFRLVYRSLLFLGSVILYIYAKVKDFPISIRGAEKSPYLFLIWGIFMVEMVLRFFPSNFESPGCQKQFRKNYTPTGSTEVKLHDNNAVVIVALLWVVLNGTFGALYMTKILNDFIMLLICLAYSVCDMICILFFCPFQTWFLKNRCCSACRIYNWDYAMMFTPLFFIPGIYSWSLLTAAVILLVRWEITIWRYPERFSENTNKYLACANCTEKLCTHKSQLLHFWKELNLYAEKQKARILAYKDKK